MKKRSLFHQIERQVEDESKEWKRKRIEELIKELGEEQAEVSPPQRKEIDQAEEDNH